MKSELDSFLSNIDSSFIQEEFVLSKSTDLPQILKALRFEKNLTQQKLADHFGLSQKTFSSLERNAYKANFSRIFEILTLTDAEIVIRKKAR